MKLKIDLTAEELTDLNNGSDYAENIINTAHEMLDEAIARRDGFVKCSVTIDSEKD